MCLVRDGLWINSRVSMVVMEPINSDVFPASEVRARSSFRGINAGPRS